MSGQIVVYSRTQLKKEIREFNKLRTNKHNNTKVKVEIDNIYKYKITKTNTPIYTFDSKSEYFRFIDLQTLCKAGIITDLKIHVPFLLQEKYINANNENIKEIRYEADFTYYKDGKFIIEDVKGFITDLFKMKKKLFESKYPNWTIDIIKN